MDEGARRLVALEPAEQLGRHAAVGAQAVVLIDDVEEGKFAFGIGSGFLRHARLLVDERPPVNRNTAVNRTAQYETVSARDPMNLPPRRAVVYEGFAAGTGYESAALDRHRGATRDFKGKRTGTGAGMAIRLTLAALAALTLLTAPALAAKKPAEPVEATAPREAGEPIMAIVSIKSQRVTFYDADGWILRAPVSTGTTGRETPAGVFAVIEKDKDHHSSMYDDAWMPNMQRITWNGIALHGGPLPGYAASHGCVRMPFPFAEKLFDRTRLGMRVIISPFDAEHSEPVDISHPVLFQPKADAIAAAPARAETAAREAADAAKDADDTKKLAATTAREAAPVTAALKKLEWQKKSTEAEVAYADKLIANAKTDSARAKAEDLKAKAEPKAAAAATALEAAKADAKTKLDAAAAAKDAAKAAVDQEDRDCESGARCQARAGTGLGLHQPRHAEAVRPPQHPQARA